VSVHILDIEVSAEGSKLAYFAPKGSDTGFRISGPKAWGGSKNIARLTITDDDLAQYIKVYAPEVIKKLTS